MSFRRVSAHEPTVFFEIFVFYGRVKNEKSRIRAGQVSMKSKNAAFYRPPMGGYIERVSELSNSF